MNNYCEALVLIQHKTTLEFFILPQGDWRSFNEDTGREWRMCLHENLPEMEFDYFECARMQGIYRAQYADQITVTHHDNGSRTVTYDPNPVPKVDVRSMVELVEKHERMHKVLDAAYSITKVPSGMEDYPYQCSYSRHVQGELFPNRVVPRHEAAKRFRAIVERLGL